MAKFRTNIDWKNEGVDVDTTSFPPALAKTYTRYTDARRKASEAKDEFERAFVQQLRQAGKLDVTETYVFAYNFGKVRVAKAAASEATAPRATPKKALSFK